MNFNASKIKSNFDRAANQYNRHAELQHDVLRTLIEQNPSFLNPAGLILDAGCGTGQLSRELSAKRVVSLDIAYSMCSAAGEAINGTIESLPLADASVDTVISSLAFQWLNDRSQGLKECYRVTKPGGALLLTCFGPSTLHELKTAFSIADDYVHVSPFPSLDELRREAEQSGYKIVRAASDMVDRHYQNLSMLMHNLKCLGAANKHTGRRGGLMTPGRIRQVERHYESLHRHPQGLRATWEVLYLTATK